jgi:hypothetical protein
MMWSVAAASDVAFYYPGWMWQDPGGRRLNRQARVEALRVALIERRH